MENGDALTYIRSTEEIVDRLRVLTDVVAGLEYLHLQGVVHGDLRAVTNSTFHQPSIHHI